tara:strand:- start:183 stop:1034 length:852 start_codon:yes stop_codon:yes gene_type:complete
MLDDLIKTANARLSGSSDRITSLGRRAAQRFIDSDDRNLTAAVSSVVSEEGDLTREQIQRVAESANQAAWKSLFVEGEGDTGVHFDPASAGDVIEEVAPRVQEIQDVSSDYDSPPPMKDIDPLLDAFESESADKYEELDPTARARGAHEKVSHARDLACTAVDSAYSTVNERGEKVYDLIKTALAEGESFVTVCKAAAAACDDPNFAEDLMKTAAQRLQSDGIKPLIKTAGAVVINEQHELVVGIREFEKAARAYVSASTVHGNLDRQSQKTLGYIRDKLRGV